MSVKLSVSLSHELATVLDEYVQRTRNDRSSAIEALLREHPSIREGLNALRQELWSRPEHATSADPLASDTRRKILDTIQQNPGMSIADLAHATEHAWGTVRHHLYILQRSGDIEIQAQARERRLFPANFPVEHREALQLLRQPETSQLLEAIQSQPGTSIADLSRRLDLSRKIIRRHLEQLTRAGILERSGDFRPKFIVTDAAKRVAP